MKLAPMLRGTAALRAIFPQKSRDGADSTLYKERADGLGAILISGANSPASLSQVTVARQVQDDLAKWTMNAAGDPEAQADSRSRAISFAKIFKISTPLVMPGCRITKSYEAGSQEKLYVPCPHEGCGHMQTLDWANMQANLDEERPEHAVFNCVACGEDIEEHHRKGMLERAEWRADNPKMLRLHRSFSIWSAYSFLQSWKQIALEWWKAKGDPEAERVFLNDTVGEAFKAQSEAPPWEALRDRAAKSGRPVRVVPAKALFLTIGVDCQDHRVEWQVVGWGREGYRAIVDYGVFPGHIGEPDTRALLDGLLEQTWPDEIGRKIGAKRTAIDGNAFTEDVWGWVKRHPSHRVIMVRGRGEDGLPLLARVKKERNDAGKLLNYAGRFYNFGTSILKMALYRHLAKTDPASRGYVDLPQGLDDEFFRQLTAETRQPVRKLGFTVYRWVKDPGQANEGLDTHLQAEAAALNLGLRSLPDAIWDKLQDERNALPLPEGASAESPQPEPADAEEQDEAPASGSWLGERTNGWFNRR